MLRKQNKCNAINTIILKFFHKLVEMVNYDWCITLT